jgi:UDP-glucuronate 4-epimerase
MTDTASDPVLVSGAAGFIGFSLARHLLAAGRPVIGVDSVND